MRILLTNSQGQVIIKTRTSWVFVELFIRFPTDADEDGIVEKFSRKRFP